MQVERQGDEPDQQGSDPEADDDQQHQQHRHGRAERPVLCGLELAGDQLAHHGSLRAAKHGSGDVVTHQRDEHQHDARDDTGACQRQRHAHERADPVCPQVFGGLAKRRAHPVKRDKQRQNHQRQVVVNDTQQHRCACVQEVERRRDNADVLQER